MRHSEARSAELGTLVGNPVQAVLVLGHVIEDCNEAACSMLGRARADIVGRSPLEFSSPVQPDGSGAESGGASRIAAALEGHPQWFPWRFRLPGGEERSTLVHLEAVTISGRRRLLAQVQDISPMLRAEHSLKESEYRLRQILDQTDSVVFWKDLAGRYLFVNRGFCALMDKPAHEIVGRRDREVMPQDVAARFELNDRLVVERRRAMAVEEQGTFGGEPRTYLVNKFPLLDPAGEPYAVCGIATDITARKRFEEAVRAAALAVSEAEGERLLEGLVRDLARILGVEVAFIATFDPQRELMRTLALTLDGQILDNIDYALDGTPCALVVGHTFQFFPDGLTERFPGDNMFKDLGARSYAAFPLNDAQGRPLGLVAAISRRGMTERDLSESILKLFAARAAAEISRRQADEELQRSEERLRATIEAALDPVVGMDAAGRIVEFNAAAERCFGYRRADVLGHPLADLIIPERHREGHRRGMARYLAHGEGPYLGRRVEVEAMRADGSEFPAELAISVAHSCEEPIFIGYMRDITDLKRAETERAQLEAQLRQAQKMEAIGHLTGGIAHDFNNILTSINGYLALAAERGEELDDPRLTRYIGLAHTAAEKARELIRQMLTFSRGQRGTPRPLSLCEVVEDVSRFLRPMLPSSLGFDVAQGDCRSEVLADPVLIEQVLMNLCINARDALGERGGIRIGVAGPRRVTGVCASCRSAIGGDFVALCVEDDGPGIAPAVLDRMFEPFFSTKAVGKGSGMGLATVHGIVHELGGHVIVETAPGTGTTFRILLPELAAPQARSTEGVEAQAAPSKHLLAGHVLVAEDEALVAGFLGELLAGWGLQVTVLPDGLAARDAFAARPHAFDLVMTDQTMPGMSGTELAAEVHRIRPDVPLVVLSAYADGIPRATVKDSRIDLLLQKPVSPRELFAKLAPLLERGS